MEGLSCLPHCMSRPRGPDSTFPPRNGLPRGMFSWGNHEIKHTVSRPRDSWAEQVSPVLGMLSQQQDSLEADPERKYSKGGFIVESLYILNTLKAVLESKW